MPQNEPSVLIVEDDLPLLRSLTMLFRSEGYEVATAANGAEALEVLDSEHADVVILDLEMPVMDGRECFRAMRERGLQTPVLLLSAYGAQRARRELGADDSLEKPFDVDQLLERVASLRAMVRQPVGASAPRASA